MIDDPLNRLKVKRGSQLPWAKLTEEDVKHIRQLAKHRNDLLAEARLLTDKKIAEKFDVTKSAMGRILYSDAWSHVVDA